MTLNDRISHAWNALRGKQDYDIRYDIGIGSGRPLHKVVPQFSASSYANTIYNRIAVDCSMVDLVHIKAEDEEGHHERIVHDGIHNCISVEANLDQSAKDFIHDLVYSMFDEGVVAVVPVETTINPDNTSAYDIITIRTGRIVQFYPKHVRVSVYNEDTGMNEEVYLQKSKVAIIENPLYSVINSRNSTLSRLMSKLSLLDMTDKVSSGSRLDIIMQMPYTTKSPQKEEQAEKRIKQLETQLNESKYGIGYFDANEKITQLNRPASNNLLEQVQILTEELYNQLGLTQNVFDGTATEAQMRQYYNRSIDPILTRLVAEFDRKFLSKTARTQGHAFRFRRDPFKLVPVEQLATIADTFSRNALLSPNEIRPIIGFGPSSDPEADKLGNRNIADKNQEGRQVRQRSGVSSSPDSKESEKDKENQNGGNSKKGDDEEVDRWNRKKV